MDDGAGDDDVPGRPVSDAGLVETAAAGDADAFAQLYARHLAAARRVATYVTGNAHDAADAVNEAAARVLEALAAGRLRDGSHFRAYLMVATRNAAIDLLRRSGRLSPTEHMEELDEAFAAEPVDFVVDAVDAAMVARAFRRLPERWQSVLWLTVVKGLSGKEAAQAIGLSPNAVAQLALRARSGLRQGFVQAHVADQRVRHRCAFTVERLGAYVSRASSSRDVAKIDQHLVGCGACRSRLGELEDLGRSLARA